MCTGDDDADVSKNELPHPATCVTLVALRSVEGLLAPEGVLPPAGATGRGHGHLRGHSQQCIGFSLVLTPLLCCLYPVGIVRE